MLLYIFLLIERSEYLYLKKVAIWAQERDNFLPIFMGFLKAITINS